MRNQLHCFFLHSFFLLRISSVIIPLFLLLLVSYRTQRQLQYLQGHFDTAALSMLIFPETIIQKGDILSIIVYSDNPELTAFYNQQPPTGTKVL